MVTFCLITAIKTNLLGHCNDSLVSLPVLLFFLAQPSLQYIHIHKYHSITQWHLILCDFRSLYLDVGLNLRCHLLWFQIVPEVSGPGVIVLKQKPVSSLHSQAATRSGSTNGAGASTTPSPRP